MKTLLHSEESLVKGPREEGIQQVLVYQRQAQDPAAEPEPAEETHARGHLHLTDQILNRFTGF